MLEALSRKTRSICGPARSRWKLSGFTFNSRRRHIEAWPVLSTGIEAIYGKIQVGRPVEERMEKFGGIGKNWKFGLSRSTPAR